MTWRSNTPVTRHQCLNCLVQNGRRQKLCGGAECGLLWRAEWQTVDRNCGQVVVKLTLWLRCGRRFMAKWLLTVVEKHR